MYCKKCGNQLDDGMQFCSYCGEKCSESPNETALPNNQNTQDSLIERILRFICMAVFVITVFVGVVQLLTSNIVGALIILLIAILSFVFILQKKKIAKIKSRCTNAIAKKLLVIAIYLLLSVVMFISIGVGGMLANESSANPKTTATSYAQLTLENSLRNPDSLQIHNTDVKISVEDENYHYYNIIIEYSAQNGFGGYNRNTYEILVKVSKDNHKASRATAKEYSDALTNHLN